MALTVRFICNICVYSVCNVIAFFTARALSYSLAWRFVSTDVVTLFQH